MLLLLTCLNEKLRTPPTNTVDFPSWKPSRCAFPRQSEPTPQRTLIDCHVFEANDQAEHYIHPPGRNLMIPQNIRRMLISTSWVQVCAAEATLG